MISFLERLNDPRPILMDGATGTELNRRGVDTALPLWSAAALLTAPEVLERIHVDYLDAGAEMVTANTFRTHARNLAAGGLADQALELTRRAVEIARRAAGQRGWVAGSQAPLEDCYRPDLTPEESALGEEHAGMAKNLAEAGVDVILVETMPTIREAVAATRAAVATGTPTMVSFICDRNALLLSGESLVTAAKAVLEFGPAAVLVNCGPARWLADAVRVLREHCGGTPVGAYANIGEADPQQGWRNTSAADPSRYALYARDWIHAGARLIGGCCGTTPAHIDAIRQLIRPG